MCILFVSAPASAANESKISCGVVVFRAKLCPKQTHVVNRIFEKAGEDHTSKGCSGVWYLLRFLDSPVHSRDSVGQSSVGRRFSRFPMLRRVENTDDGRTMARKMSKNAAGTTTQSWNKPPQHELSFWFWTEKTGRPATMYLQAADSFFIFLSSNNE